MYIVVVAVDWAIAQLVFACVTCVYMLGWRVSYDDVLCM